MAIEKTEEGLKRVVGVSGLALAIINGVIGAGIFALPAIVGAELGAFAIFGYLFCGIMLATMLLCYAEIGSRVTSSGGSYAYVEAAFGDFAGYIINWLYFFGWSILGSAALLNVIADSLAVLFPVFTNPLIRGVFFFVLLGIITLINVLGAKQGIGFVKGIAIIKLVPLLGIIIFGFGKVSASNLQWEQLPSVKTFGDTALVLFFAFAGFETCLGVSGEFKNPKRTVPLGILLGGIVVLSVYMLLQMVTQGVLGSDIALFKDAPLAAVAEKIIGPVGATILLIVAAISCFGTVSADVMATPRSLFAGANDGMFPKFLGRVHPTYATPHLAIITYAVLIFIFSVAGGFKQLAILASAAILLVYLAVIFSTLKLRKQKQPANEKTFRAPGGLATPVIGMAVIIWLLSSLSKWEILSTIIFIAVVCVIYFIMKKSSMKNNSTLLVLLFIPVLLIAQKPRARDIGIPFDGTPGKFNAITDVKGVEVGYSTIISGSGKNIRGKGPVRTGVTAILPRGHNNNPVYANWYSLNGNGEMTGTTWVTESGFLEGPVMITNTNSVGVVRDAVLKWYVKTGWYNEDFWYTYPVVAETYDGFLNDIYGFHVKEENAFEALDNAKSGFIQEGNVGGGTGMMCLGFKGGTGTASRIIKIKDSTYTIGVFVQSNFGAKRNLRIAGVPVGQELKDTMNYEFKAAPSYQPGDGSIIVVVATDAPLLPHQLKRIAARVPLGVGIVGGRGENGSGDIFIAFSTANAAAFQREEFTKLDELPNDLINPLFNGTVQAVEEAIINAMVAAETMEGINGNKAYGLPHQLVIDILKKYNRIH